MEQLTATDIPAVSSKATELQRCIAVLCKVVTIPMGNTRVHLAGSGQGAQGITNGVFCSLSAPTALQADQRGGDNADLSAVSPIRLWMRKHTLCSPGRRLCTNSSATCSTKPSSWRCRCCATRWVSIWPGLDTVCNRTVLFLGLRQDSANTVLCLPAPSCTLPKHFCHHHRRNIQQPTTNSHANPAHTVCSQFVPKPAGCGPAAVQQTSG